MPALGGRALALDYPARPLRWIVGFPPGGGTDTVARIMAQWLSERLRQSVIIENRPGASTNLSIQAAVAAPADGYTLVCVTASARSTFRSTRTCRSIFCATSRRSRASSIFRW